ncbi:hypothetical protein Q6316_28070, partial [Klebsiella pneumoniae]|uniref:hypothetical protein n=1 Tax=Klebsiella pneumoniae TaxID=573 RepID=UPI0027313BB8
MDKWTFNGPEGQESVAINTSPFLVNSADAMKTAITSGMGVGLLPTPSRYGRWVGRCYSVKSRSRASCSTHSTTPMPV